MYNNTDIKFKFGKKCLFLSNQNPLMRRKRFVSIRNEVRNQRRENDDGVPVNTSSVHYLASQYLADSSLSTEVNEYDFTSTVSASVSTIEPVL